MFRVFRCRPVPAFALVLTAFAGLSAFAQESAPPPAAAAPVQSAKTAPAAAVPVVLPPYRDLGGKTHDGQGIRKSKATVFLFTSTQCPVANLYTPRLLELGREYGKRGVSFVLVYSNPEENASGLRAYLKERKLTAFPAVPDKDARLADALGAFMTPEAVALDARGVVRYRGRIDDNRDRTKVVRHDLRDALDALLTGKPVPRPRTLAFGCAIYREPSLTKAAAAIGAPVTYARDVAPILFKNCLSCHRTGEVGPFPLETYRQAKTWAAAIKYDAMTRKMPPWKAAPGYGDFKDAHYLTDAEIATLARWADAGAPEGDPKATPRLPKFPQAAEWTLGKPDIILKSPRPYHLAADGKDVYRQFVLPIDFPEDMYVSGVEFKPDKRAVVHHMIAYLDPHAESVKLDGKESEPGYSVPGTGIGVRDDMFIAGWAPGGRPSLLPDGTAFRLKKGSKLVLQVHYSKNGAPQADQSSVALYLAKAPVEREMRVWAAVNTSFVLKPGVANQPVKAEMELPADVTVWSVAPHMHMLGKSMKMTARLPDGTEKPMIWIKAWDFNWQDSYLYREPMRLPKGTKVIAEAVYDNSDRNPNQPSLPPKEVRWGEQTTDEMCIGFFSVTVDAESLSIPARGTATTAKR